MTSYQLLLLELYMLHHASTFKVSCEAKNRCQLKTMPRFPPHHLRAQHSAATFLSHEAPGMQHAAHCCASMQLCKKHKEHEGDQWQRCIKACLAL